MLNTFSRRSPLLLSMGVCHTARKRKFEGNELEWKKWRDANYKITDLVEADTYY